MISQKLTSEIHFFHNTFGTMLVDDDDSVIDESSDSKKLLYLLGCFKESDAIYRYDINQDMVRAQAAI